jgi:hypothetical protein
MTDIKERKGHMRIIKTNRRKEERGHRRRVKERTTTKERAKEARPSTAPEDESFQDQGKTFSPLTTWYLRTTVAGFVLHTTSKVATRQSKERMNAIRVCTCAPGKAAVEITLSPTNVAQNGDYTRSSVAWKALTTLPIRAKG